MKQCKYCKTTVDNSIMNCTNCGSTDFSNFCDNCGNIFEGGAHCPVCGVRFGASPKRCPRCGGSYYSNACPNCGYSQLNTLQPVQTNQVPQISPPQYSNMAPPNNYYGAYNVPPQYPPYSPPVYLNEKSKGTALLLCFFLGCFGAHKFYEDKTGMGVLYLLTVGLCGIGPIVDFIVLLTKPSRYIP